MTEHQERSVDGEADTADRSEVMQGTTNLFSPFSTNNFGTLFSGDLGVLQSYGHSSNFDRNPHFEQQNGFGASMEHSNDNPWGTSLRNHFSSLSLDPHTEKNDPLVSDQENSEGIGLFRNPASLSPRSQSNPPYGHQFLWNQSNGTTANEDFTYPPREPISPFSVLDYSPPRNSSVPNMPSNDRTQRDFTSSNFSMNLNVPANPMASRPANPAFYNSYNPNQGAQNGYNGQSSEFHAPMKNIPTMDSQTREPVTRTAPEFTVVGTSALAQPLADENENSQIFSGNGNGNGNTQICRYFANGNCMRGDRCNYRHIAPEGNVIRKDDKKKDKHKRTFNSNQKANPRGRGRGIVPAEPKKPAVDVSRFTSIDQVIGQVYRTCKDQHGCRFLQKKLEEKDQNPKAVDIIFNEVYDYMVELMTDPFGNYLCQKLIEHCSQQQQLLIVQKVAPHLVSISKNMHGTRAVQKMIECLCTPPQVQLVVNSLRSSVVPLIKDLNGNHVIQRCLHELSYQNKQFVYDAVAANCVEVATHRHGCCVMQRCIDSASEEQKLQLVKHISSNVLYLVQDQFGNYVVQYVLDLPFATVKVDLIQEFLGSLSRLSTQKFSSNVIEKCLRVADDKVKIQLIDELMASQSLMSLLQDAYGNYVIQTALSQAHPQQRANLEEKIRPLLPALRNTNYGKRIQNKIALRDMDF
uniref:PUM-HD domain-containing protein n=1 Tax=Vannella robusta TaxID=1487602 RepID=A0A7S4IEM7_9EUKA|mmetsp:Transcript_24684/g.31404  ORF Transcript_24684/g.31404 Transcript_24684/m.31404 type:complete len:691 (+) Transcript_24684:45-2117(+)